MSNLASKSITSVIWGMGSILLRFAMQVGVQVTFARLLGPEALGVFAIGTLVVTFSSFLSDIGLAYGLIQKKEVTKKDIRFVMFCQYVLATLVGSSVFFSAETISDVLSNSQAYSVIQFLSIVIVFNCLTAVPQNILKRNLDYKEINLYYIVSYVVGYFIFGLPLAFMGNGIDAMVIAWVVQSGIYMLLTYWKVRPPLVPLIWQENSICMLKYAVSVFLTNAINWFSNNVDRVLLSRYYGAQNTGLYTTPYNLVYAPSSTIVSVLQPILFSAASRKQDDFNAQRTAFLGGIGIVSIAIVPVYFAIAALSDEVVFFIYGPEWSAAAGPLLWLALCMPCILVQSLSTPFLWTANKAGKEFLLQVPTLLATSLVLFYTISINATIDHFAMVVFVLILMRSLVVLSFSAFYLGINFLCLIRVLLPGFLSAFVIFFTTKCLKLYVSSSLGNSNSLMILSGFSLLMFIIGFIVGCRKSSTPVVFILSKLFEKLPMPVGKFFSKVIARNNYNV